MTKLMFTPGNKSITNACLFAILILVTTGFGSTPLSSASGTVEANTTSFDDQITSANWQNNRSIVAIRKLVAAIDRDLKKGSLKHHQREFDSCPDQYYTVRRIAQNSKGVIVWYEEYSEYEDGSYRFQYYYDEAGKLRFVYASTHAANGTRAQHRIYFNEKGKRLWESDNNLAGPGCPGCFVNPYPADQLAFHPKEEFEIAKGCVEKKTK